MTGIQRISYVQYEQIIMDDHSVYRRHVGGKWEVEHLRDIWDVIIDEDEIEKLEIAYRRYLWPGGA